MSGVAILETSDELNKSSWDTLSPLSRISRNIFDRILTSSGLLWTRSMVESLVKKKRVHA